MLIYFSKEGHSIVKDSIIEKAMKLLEQGYQFYENLGTEDKVELGDIVKPDEMIETKSYFGLLPHSGG